MPSTIYYYSSGSMGPMRPPSGRGPPWVHGIAIMAWAGGGDGNGDSNVARHAFKHADKIA